ncbi:phosphoglycolate phosphatase (plasmid) [Pararobbsia alpina]|uniref:HAD family hydrolase n=1 Tax=Pararobbsia alpina TaxID=621374 RepID=UPI0039A5BB17
MIHAVIFDIDGTLVDSVDLHALAWHEAFRHFGHAVTFEQARSQIGKGGDQLLPAFLSQQQMSDHGETLEQWRAQLFKSTYLSCVRPFSAVAQLLECVRDIGLTVAVASSAKEDEVRTYLEIAGVANLVDVISSSSDAEKSKPAPDIFQAVLAKLQLRGADTLAVGDTPYDAQAAIKAGLNCIGVLCGGFTEADLRSAGCLAVYPGPAAPYACFSTSPIALMAR